VRRTITHASFGRTGHPTVGWTARITGVPRGAVAGGSSVVFWGRSRGKMNVLLRMVSMVVVLLFAGAPAFTVIMMGREREVRVLFDLGRLVVALGTVIVMAGVVGVGTPFVLVGVGLLGGLLLGVFQGLNLKVRLEGAKVFVRRNLWGVLSWGSGICLIQLSAVLSTVGVMNPGLTISLYGIGQTSGLMTGRWHTVKEVRRAATTPVALLIVLLLLCLACWCLAGGGGGGGRRNRHQVLLRG
jgi:hypothetical protein